MQHSQTKVALGDSAGLYSSVKEFARGEKILVVEGELYVRRFMFEGLSDLDCNVSSAGHAIQALE